MDYITHIKNQIDKDTDNFCFYWNYRKLEYMDYMVSEILNSKNQKRINNLKELIYPLRYYPEMKELNKKLQKL